MEGRLRRFVRSAGIGVFALCCAFGQAPTRPAFDVATVKPNRNGTGKGGASLAASPGMLTIRNLPLRTIIAAVYNLAEYQISGPHWREQERFDVVAKTDGSVTGEDELLPLLQLLLAEHFHLAMHRETRHSPPMF
jgi:uncharacterized protein (TIGR03435 family)